MTDFKTIIYDLTTNATSGNFSFASSLIAPADVSFNNGANWSNQTASLEPTDNAGVNLTNIGGINYAAVGAVWYFGSAAKFDTLCLQFNSGTDNTGTRTATWEYWDGVSWTTMAQTGSTQRCQVTGAGGNIAFVNGSNYQIKFHPDIYNNWATVSVNGGAARYYVRVTIGTSALTSATLGSVSVWDHYTNYGYNNFDTAYTTVMMLYLMM
jgi:hypothetical protein